MAGEWADKMNDLMHRALDHIIILNVKLSNMTMERDEWKARAERAEAERDTAATHGIRAEVFIAEFAEFKFTEAPRPHIRDPQDEPDQYVDAQEVWAWQSDARELLK